MVEIPQHWKAVSWEQMAQENPMFAVMTTEEMRTAQPRDFTQDQLESFFEKGRRMYRKRIFEAISPSLDPAADSLVVEYGCGMGRILNAVLERGSRAAGIDISPTMLEHCRRLVPGVEALYGLDEDGRCAMPSETASAVVSFAVVQHIASLKTYLAAFDEMCRVLKPGGRLAIQVNCTDFLEGGFDAPGRTENFETCSLHYKPGETDSYMRHEQNQWSGVYISQEFLKEFLGKRGVKVTGWMVHSKLKPLGVWMYARKPGPAPALNPAEG